MSTFTWGPWAAHWNGTCWQIDARGTDAVATTQFCYAAETEANARLIAAAPDGVRTHAPSFLLAEVRCNGVLHHYRVLLSEFVLLCPPEWIAPESYPALREAGLTVPEVVGGLVWESAT